MKQCPTCKRDVKNHLVFCPFDGQPLIEKTETDSFVGMLLDYKYRLEEMVGQGGMGTVYRAMHVEMENKVAVKILHPHLAFDEIALERFRREARSAAKIRHPNAVTVSDFGVTKDAEIAYLVMEFLEGEDLRQRIKRKKQVGYDDICLILKQTCSAVHAAHVRGIIHRDLKPDNIWLLDTEDQGTHVKVLDFGIAKLKSASGGSDLTQKGMIVGTPYYMSPEQCRGEELDAGSDIYSLGVILYEMITGKVPFDGDTPLAVVLKHNNESPRPLHELRRDVQEQVEEVVLRALSKRSEERQKSTLQLAEQFEEGLYHAVLGSGGSGSRISASTVAAKSYLPHNAGKQELANSDAPTKLYAAARPGSDSPVELGSVDSASSPAPGILAPVEANAVADVDSRNFEQDRSESATPPHGASISGDSKVQGISRMKVSFITMTIVIMIIGLILTFVLLSRRSGPSEPVDAPLTTAPARMALIRGGTFMMGTDDPHAQPEWRPAHAVIINDFYLDLYEVTNEEYSRFVRQTGHSTPSHWKDGSYPKTDSQLPVYNVSWYDAKAYAEWAGKRLPTEAEWEYAARGADGRKYPWGNEWYDELTVSGEDRAPKPAAVGSFPRSNSPFGIFDMAGNVAEWVNDDFTLYPGSTSKPAPGYKIYRGGNYRISGKDFATTARWTETANEKLDTIGFRCAKDVSR